VLNVLQDPVALLGSRTRVAERGPIHQRRLVLEQGLDQWGEFDDAVDRIGHAPADTKCHPPGTGTRGL
jgi:hypothetical protein